MFFVQSVGCDLELESRERFDRCGVCKGNGSSCRKTSVNRIKTPTLFVNASDRPRFTAKKLNISQNATILASNVRGYTNNSKGFVMQNMTLTSTGTSKHRNPNGTSQHRNLLVNKPLNQTGMKYRSFLIHLIRKKFFWPSIRSFLSFLPFQYHNYLKILLAKVFALRVFVNAY